MVGLGSAKRGKDETFEVYKERRKRETYYMKFYLKGRVIWNSSQNGTYRKPIEAK